jgi:hypothetical protein
MAPPTNSVTALLGRIRDEQRLARSLTNAMAATKPTLAQIVCHCSHIGSGNDTEEDHCVLANDGSPGCW